MIRNNFQYLATPQSPTIFHGEPIFGLRELEYEFAPLDPVIIVWHAYSISEYLLRSGKNLANGETIGVEGQQMGFAISYAEMGSFGSYPVARLSFVPQHNKS